MRLLIDTHAFLWLISNDRQLTQRSRELLEDGENDLLLSVASLWEMAIKQSIGKLELDAPFSSFISEQLALNSVAVLDITMEHLSVVATLARHHRDPFDRLIIAQAIEESLPVVSIDEKFDAYPVERLW